MRVPYYERIAERLGGNHVVVSFFTSFVWEAPISDPDADMLEEVLQNTSLNGKSLVLILNSPGGDGLAAERIINICRSYCPSGFNVVVPKMAKSAATMICFGANEILMSRTSELGPIDPQIAIHDDSGHFIGYQAAHELIESYEDLLRRATRTKGRLEPFLQQLARFDARHVRRIKSAQDLTESIAVKCLKTGIFKRLSEPKIRAKIKPFLDPKFTTDHGRPIYHDVASACGLAVRVQENKDDLWREIWALYVRLNYLLSSAVSKVIESASDSYVSSVQRREH
jgi:ATP-dependent protease ClpP protease subunit